MTDPRFRDQLAEVAAHWAADPGEPISDEDWDGLASGFRAFLRTRGELLADALMPLIAAEVKARVQAAAPADGFCTCEPGLPMRDCGIPGHRVVAHHLRGSR